MSSRVLILLVLISLTIPAAHAAGPAPVDCTQLMAWTAAGVPSSSLVRIVQSRGVGFVVSPRVHGEFLLAGATTDMMNALAGLKPAIGSTSSCAASLAEATALLHKKQYEPAGDRVSALIENDPHNGALHFALGYIKQQNGL